jgi:hypothetical protein
MPSSIATAQEQPKQHGIDPKILLNILQKPKKKKLQPLQ